MMAEIDFVALALERIERADQIMAASSSSVLRAKHERSVAHVYAVLANVPVWLEPLECVEGEHDEPAESEQSTRES